MFFRTTCFVLLFAIQSAGTSVKFSHAGRGSEQSVSDLLVRVLGTPTASSTFELTLVDACSTPPPPTSRSKLCFEITPGSKTGHVAISGTSGIELARGVAHYLREKVIRNGGVLSWC